MGPTCGPPGSCRPQMGPMLVPWTLLSGCIHLRANACLLIRWMFFLLSDSSNDMATPRSTQRLLLKDWLIKQLDNNVYSSCKWVDRDQMTFFVPWMHQSRHEFDKAEAQIFEVKSIFSPLRSIPADGFIAWRNFVCLSVCQNWRISLAWLHWAWQWTVLWEPYT